MVYIDVTIRCDYPGCGRSIQDQIPVPRLQPRFHNALSAGWRVPAAGDRDDTPCYCAEHKGMSHAVP